MAEPRRPMTIVLRFFIGLLIAVVVAEAGARVAEASGPPALRWYDATTQLKIEQMDALPADVDVVFAGTSMVWQGFDPDTFTAADGRSAYNAGLAGGVPVVMEPWLLDQVIPRARPDLVVWGLSSLDFSATYGADNLERYRDALETRHGMLAAIERATASMSALVGYRTVLRDPGALFGTERDRIEDDFAEAELVLGPAGVRRDFRLDVGEERGSTVAARVADFALDPADLAALARTVEALRADGIDVVFAEMPVPDRFVALHPNRLDDLDRVHRATSALGVELGVPVVDLRSGYTDADFVDFTHLDEDGAHQLTETLVARLAGAQPDDEGDPNVIVDLAVLAGAVNDSAYRLLAGLNPAASSEFWYGAQHYGHLRDLTVAAAAGDRPEVVFLGSSLMVNAVVPAQFSEADGRSAFNAAIPGTEPAMLDRWIRDVVPLTEPEVIVWGISPLFFRPVGTDPAACGPLTEAWATASELRGRVFESVPGAEQFTDEDLLFGVPPVADPPYVSALHDNYRRNFTPDGGRTRWPRQSDQAKEKARDALVEAMETFYVCEPRVDQFLGTVAWLTEQGIDVVLVAMPISDLQATSFPNGRTDIVEILDGISQRAIEAGAVLYLDLSETLGDERFRDLRHLDKRGAERFTTRLVERTGKTRLLSRERVASPRSQVPGTRYSVLGTRYSVLGTRYSVLGTRYSVLGTRYSVLGTRYSVQATHRRSVPPQHLTLHHLTLFYVVVAWRRGERGAAHGRDNEVESSRDERSRRHAHRTIPTPPRARLRRTGDTRRSRHVAPGGAASRRGRLMGRDRSSRPHLSRRRVGAGGSYDPHRARLRAAFRIDLNAVLNDTPARIVELEHQLAAIQGGSVPMVYVEQVAAELRDLRTRRLTELTLLAMADPSVDWSREIGDVIAALGFTPGTIAEVVSCGR